MMTMEYDKLMYWIYFLIGNVFIIAAIDEEGSQIVTLVDAAYDQENDNSDDPDLGVLPSDIALNLTFSDDNWVNLTLHRNDKINLNVPVYFLDSAEMPLNIPATDGVAFYQDPSNGAVMSAAVVKEEGHIYRKYEGMFTHASRQYELRPFDFGASVQEGQNQTHTSRRRRQTYRHSTYRIHKSKERTYADDKNKVHSKKYRDKITKSSGSGPHGKRIRRRHKRAVGDYKFTHVEISFVADYSEWKYWLKKALNDINEAARLLKLHLVYQMNGMDMIFNSIDQSSLGFSISLWLKEIKIARTKLDSPWTANNTYAGDPTKVDTGAALNEFSEWRGHESPVGWNWADPDIAMLWTRLHLVDDSGTSAIIGLAWVCGVCQNKKGASIVEDVGYDAFLVSAHELGHNLGAAHDEDGNNCFAADHYLMSPTMAHLWRLNETLISNPFSFSPCSLEDMANCINGITDEYPKTCISNTVCDHAENLPAVTYAIDEQCVSHYGAGSVLCDKKYTSGNLDYDRICSEFWCTHPNVSGQCISSTGRVPVEGTECTPSGDGTKVCFRAKCVMKEVNVFGTEFCMPTGIALEVPNNCPEDWGYTISVYGGPQLSCPEVTAQIPQLCLTYISVTEFCCAACHRAGLVYQNQADTNTDPPTTTDARHTDNSETSVGLSDPTNTTPTDGTTTTTTTMSDSAYTKTIYTKQPHTSTATRGSSTTNTYRTTTVSPSTTTTTIASPTTTSHTTTVSPTTTTTTDPTSTITNPTTEPSTTSATTTGPPKTTTTTLDPLATIQITASDTTSTTANPKTTTTATTTSASTFISTIPTAPPTITTPTTDYQTITSSNKDSTLTTSPTTRATDSSSPTTAKAKDRPITTLASRTYPPKTTSITTTDLLTTKTTTTPNISVFGLGTVGGVMLICLICVIVCRCAKPVVRQTRVPGRAILATSRPREEIRGKRFHQPIKRSTQSGVYLYRPSPNYTADHIRYQMPPSRTLNGNFNQV